MAAASGLAQEFRIIRILRAQSIRVHTNTMLKLLEENSFLNFHGTIMNEHRNSKYAYEIMSN